MSNFLSQIVSLLTGSQSSPPRVPTNQRPDFQGPLGHEYTDPYGRRIYQSHVEGVPPVVMGRAFSPPEGHAQSPDLYMDPTAVDAYYKYMAELPGTAYGPKYRNYYRQLEQSVRDAHRRQAELNMRR